MSHRTTLTRRRLLGAALATPFVALRAQAAARPYQIDAKAARIQFIFNLSGVTQTGTAPLVRSNLSIDPTNLTGSRADVSADISRARTGLVFVTEALKSEQVLHSAAFPNARFRSTKVTLGRGGRISDGAALEGQLTLRGVTRPVRFDASLFRPAGGAADDLSVLDVHLRGRISRAAFGAVGYPKLVADAVDLDLRATIRAAR